MSSVEHARMSSTSSCDESPRTKTRNISNMLGKARDSGVNSAPSASRFAGPGVDFKGKLIGVEDVAETRGDKMCQIAMAKLKAGVKAAREHKLRISVNVSLDGLKIIDEKSAEVLYEHEVNRISFISRDIGDSRAFGYVYQRKDGSHQFFGIKTEKAAEALVMSLRDLFQVVFDIKKQEAEASSSDAGAVATDADAKSESDEKHGAEQSEGKSEEEVSVSTTAENLLNLEVEFQNLSKRSAPAPPISPLWTTVDPWKATVQVPHQQPAIVAVPGVPVMGSTQLYQGTTVVMSPYVYGGQLPPATTAVHQTPVGPSPFNSTSWPPPPQPQVPGVESFVVSSTAGLATPLSPPNGNVLRSTDARRMPGRGGGGASPSPGNPFVAAAFPPAATTAPDPFAQLATGLMSATPRKKPDKNDFIPEIPKPSLADLSQQQQQQQQQQQLGSNVTAQTNVDLFGATPFSTALTTGASVNDPFA